jgi:hypothetical protein
MHDSVNMHNLNNGIYPIFGFFSVKTHIKMYSYGYYVIINAIKGYVLALQANASPFVNKCEKNCVLFTKQGDHSLHCLNV